MIKVNWDVEELVALIDIHRKSLEPNYDVDAALQQLSAKLISRSDKLGIIHDEKFRNINGMKMMYQNVLFVATNGRQGLSAASTRMQKVYSLLISNPDVFEMILEEFNQRY